ncbi:mtDNA inheritance protein Dml1 [Purpureocillium lavendulum]|uniref:MtDNA inheritance protein Dml1 n=1 Tax=Purpureocillium lavendulum TaxID=1247861 RepID=A0AB34FMF5_9HYPO|nr:mtDNA inheritance protein Dml1 [Purpureocillium lavendulum]
MLSDTSNWKYGTCSGEYCRASKENPDVPEDCEEQALLHEYDVVAKCALDSPPAVTAEQEVDDVKLNAPLFGHECFQAVPRVDANARRELPSGASTTLDSIIASKDFAK